MRRRSCTCLREALLAASLSADEHVEEDDAASRYAYIVGWLCSEAGIPRGSGDHILVVIGGPQPDRA